MRFRRRRLPMPPPPDPPGPEPSIDVGAATAVGGRPDNQDRCSVTTGLAVVSDGMGGYRGGGRAAQLSVDAAVAALGEPSAAGQPPDPARRVRAAFRDANDAVRAARAADPAVGEMGATLTVAVRTEATTTASRWLVGHVGDSPAFVVTGDRTIAVTTDHNRSAELVAAGVLTEAQAASHPGRHLLVRAIGPDPTVEVDLAEVVLGPGESLLLCSDGVSGTLARDELAVILRADAPAADLARRLVESAVTRGATDNVTSVVVRQVASSAA